MKDDIITVMWGTRSLFEEKYKILFIHQVAVIINKVSMMKKAVIKKDIANILKAQKNRVFL